VRKNGAAVLPICVRARLFIKGFALAAAHLVKKLSCFPERRAHYSCTQLWGFSGRRAKMCERPPSPLAYLSSQEDQSAQGKETRYDVTRLDILEAFGFAGPGVSGLIDH
jgi:hypothetical protein